MNINDLYKKISDFESHLSSDFKNKLECRKGCNQCCYVDLSVFQIEADNIKSWFNQLDNQTKNELISKLQIIQPDKTNFHGENSKACTFLRNDECLIYPVRPLICRTQGNAFQFTMESNTYLDICPLNELALDEMQKEDVINLDLINSILVKMNQQSGYDQTRVSLKDISSKDLP